MSEQVPWGSEPGGSRRGASIQHRGGTEDKGTVGSAHSAETAGAGPPWGPITTARQVNARVRPGEGKSRGQRSSEHVEGITTTRKGFNKDSESV